MAIRYLSQGLLDPQLMDVQARQPRTEIAALIKELHQIGNRVDTADHERGGRIHDDIMDDLFAQRFFSLTIPTSYGGWGGNMLEFVHCIRELARHDAALVVTAVPHLGNGIKSVNLFGSDQQKEDVLRNLSEDKRLVSFAITEAHTGSDVASHRARLVADGDGFRPTGNQTWITNVPSAGHIVVEAKCPGLSRNPDGSVFVLVSPEDKGFSVSRKWHKMGIAASPTLDLFLDDIAIGQDRIVGSMGGAMRQFPHIVGSGRMGAAAGACGLAQRAVEYFTALNFTDHRFRIVCDHFEDRLAAMAATLETTAVWHDLESPDQELDTSLCKTFCTTSAVEIISAVYRHCLDRLGHVPQAFCQLMREIPVFRVFEGPNEVLGYRTALSMLTMLRRPLEAPELEQTEHLREEREIYNHVLQDFHLWLKQGTQRPMLMLQHELLAHVADVATQVYAAGCTLARASQPEADARIISAARTLLHDVVSLIHHDLAEQEARNRETAGSVAA